MPKNNRTEKTPPIRSTGLVRVRAEWRDCDAGVVYLLQKYIETPPILRIFPWVKHGDWETVAMFTARIQKAKAWADHYGVEIEYEPGLKHSNEKLRSDVEAAPRNEGNNL